MSEATRRLDPWRLLRSSPIALPQLIALVALVSLSASEGGFPVEHWSPAAILVALLLAVATASFPVRSRAGWSRTAIACIVGFTAWTALSLLWADDRGAAATASTRTALLAVTFVLFARWRHSPRAALTVTTMLTAGLGVLAWAAVVQLRGATNLDPWFLYDRLLEPIGYVNAGAAFWAITAFLGIGLISGRVPLPYRLVGAVTVVPASALSLLCLSRGGILASVVVVILLLAALPGRARNGAAFLLAGAGFGLAAPALIDVGPAVSTHATDAVDLLHRSLDRTIVGAVLTTLLVVVWAGIERVVPVGDRRRTLAARAGAGLIALAGVVALACVLGGVGPVTTKTIRDEAHSITRPYSESTASDSRLTAGLNSARWDFWTVAWKQFEKAPVLGAGADNYRQDYLLLGTSPENPRYPHSVWLRALGELGIVGGLLLLGWVLAVAIAVRRVAAQADPAGRAVALGAGGAFGLWVVHGSADWLLEYGGLTAIVGAAAGLAVSAGPQARLRGTRTVRIPVPLSRLATAASVVLMLAVAAWTGTQWLANRDRANAAILASAYPDRAKDRAERARKLDPFSEQPQSLLGALAITRGQFAEAEQDYLAAYDRNPRATRPRLWLGVLASARGDQKNARRWMRRAARSARRDPIVQELERQVRAKLTLDPVAVQHALADRTAQLVRDPDPVAPTSPPAPAVEPPAAAG